MFRLTSQDRASALLQANEYAELYWSIWRYSANSQVLVLLAHEEPFKPQGYLLFRKPISICFPWQVQTAHFAQVEEVAAEPGSELEPNGDVIAKNVIVITSHGHRYRVVCEDVAFYQQDSSDGD